jgi:hypothetical protein
LVFNQSDDAVSHNSFSESILPYSQLEIHPEATTNMVSENIQEFAHPDDVAAMNAEYVVPPRSTHRLKLTAFRRWSQAYEEDDEYLKAQALYVPPQLSTHQCLFISPGL